VVKPYEWEWDGDGEEEGGDPDRDPSLDMHGNFTAHRLRTGDDTTIAQGGACQWTGLIVIREERDARMIRLAPRLHYLLEKIHRTPLRQLSSTVWDEVDDVLGEIVDGREGRCG